MSCVPSNGSSGGPVVDNESGSVVGVTRGELSNNLLFELGCEALLIRDGE